MTTRTRGKGLVPVKGLVAKKDGVYAVVETVTPEVALDVLTNRNSINRSLNRHLVEQLSDSITSGEWALNGQSISFNTDGNLQDGQHRLSAIARAEMPVKVLVVYNVDPATRPTVDVGRKRTVADEFTMRGEANAITVAAILMMKKRIELPGSGRNVVLTTTEAIRLLDEHPVVRDAAEFAHGIRMDLSMPASVIGYCTMKFRELSINDDLAFWEVYSSGQYNGPGDPRFVLQKTLARLARNPNFSTAQFASKIHQAAITVKAWNAYRNQREIQLLRFSARAENFPEPV